MRRWGITLAVLGVLMLVAGGALRFVVVPSQQKLPADTNDSVSYTGNLTTLDVAALMRGSQDAVVQLPVTVARTLKVLSTSGDNALVSDTASMKSTAGDVPPSLAKTENLYTIDRVTMEAVPNYTDNQKVTKAEGLVVGFPIGTEKKAYTGWSAEAGTTGRVQYVREDQLKGLTVYQFAGTLTAPMAPPSGAPTTLPKSQIGSLGKAIGLPAAVQQQLAQALGSLPDQIPLTYSLTEGDTYSVEPDTGVIVDMTRNLRITVGISGLPLQPIPVMALGMKYDPASVTAMADKASSARSDMMLFGTWLPIGLGVAGVALLVVGLLMARRHPDGGAGLAAPSTPEQHPSPVG